jgi:hypothetical protein
MRQTLLTTLLLTLLLLGLSGCNNAQEQKYKAIQAEIEKIQDQLPIDLKGMDMQITAIALEGDFIQYTAELTPETWKMMSATVEEQMRSDESVAALLTTLPDETRKMMKESGVGLRYVYVDSQTGQRFFSFDITPARLAQVEKKVASGQLKTHSFLERTQLEFEHMTFPVDFGNGVVLERGWVQDLIITYEYQMAEKQGTANERELADMKFLLISELRATPAINAHQKSILKEGVGWEYIYHNSEGGIWADLLIRGNEVF